MKKRLLTIMLAMALVLSLGLLTLVPAAATQPCSVSWFHEDTVTKGNWYPTAEGSPIGVYGSYAYILPDPPSVRSEDGIGDFSAPVGFDLGDPSTWSLLSSSPWNWTTTQINGLVNYKDAPPYWDEYVPSPTPGDSDTWVTYEAHGTLYDLGLEPPNTLLNPDDGTIYTRASCWFAGSGTSPSDIDFSLDLDAGSYLLSLYILDYDDKGREQDITVSVVGASDTYSASNFQGGLYENFFIHLAAADSVDVNVVKTTVGSNAVVSGVFLSSTSILPTNSAQNKVYHESEDSTTKGSWTGTYGDLGFIKCAWNVPSTGTAYYSYNPSYDETNMAYTVDTSQYAWTSTSTWVDSVQYPVFEWAWEAKGMGSASEPRAVYYPIAGQWRKACWDDGGERSQPEHGYMDFHLTFPEGTYLLSLYAYDEERTTRASQTYEIYDETGTTLLVSKQISGDAFNDGIYETFKVVAESEGCTIIVRVYNDAGHPDPNINVLLSGIFVDKLEEIQIEVSIDIKPGSCPNPLSGGGVLPVAILGTEDFDVNQIDPDTVELEGVAPLRWSFEDVATPFIGGSDPMDCMDCTTQRGDGYLDMTLKFDKKAIIEAVITNYEGPFEFKDCQELVLTGELFDGTPFTGKDVVRIQFKVNSPGGSANRGGNHR